MEAAPDPLERPGRRHHAWLPWLVLLAFVAASISIKAWMPVSSREAGRTRAWPTLPWPAAGFVWAMPRLIPVFVPDTLSGSDTEPAASSRWLTPDLADVARAVMKGRR